MTVFLADVKAEKSAMNEGLCGVSSEGGASTVGVGNAVPGYRHVVKQADITHIHDEWTKAKLRPMFP